MPNISVLITKITKNEREETPKKKKKKSIYIHESASKWSFFHHERNKKYLPSESILSSSPLVNLIQNECFLLESRYQQLITSIDKKRGEKIGHFAPRRVVYHLTNLSFFSYRLSLYEKGRR